MKKLAERRPVQLQSAFFLTPPPNPLLWPPHWGSLWGANSIEDPIGDIQLAKSSKVREVPRGRGDLGSLQRGGKTGSSQDQEMVPKHQGLKTADRFYFAPHNVFKN